MSEPGTFFARLFAPVSVAVGVVSFAFGSLGTVLVDSLVLRSGRSAASASAHATAPTPASQPPSSHAAAPVPADTGPLAPAAPPTAAAKPRAAPKRAPVSF